MKTLSLMKNRKPAFYLGLPALLLAGFLASPTAQGAWHSSPRLVAAVDVNFVLEAPPPPREEVIVERDRPSRDHVWVRGYWANRRGHHEWVGGHWELPPRGRTLWVEPRWEKRDRGYVFVEGYWAEGHHEHDRH